LPGRSVPVFVFLLLNPFSFDGRHEDTNVGWKGDRTDQQDGAPTGCFVDDQGESSRGVYWNANTPSGNTCAGYHMVCMNEVEGKRTFVFWGWVWPWSNVT
jgi:hypothetical protein